MQTEQFDVFEFVDGPITYFSLGSPRTPDTLAAVLGSLGLVSRVSLLSPVTRRSRCIIEIFARYGHAVLHTGAPATILTAVLRTWVGGGEERSGNGMSWFAPDSTDFLDGGIQLLHPFPPDPRLGMLATLPST